MPKPPPPNTPLLPPVEEVAQAIVDIAAAMKKMNETRLRKSAIIVLIHAQLRGVGKREIELVLDSLENMDKTWLRPLEKAK